MSDSRNVTNTISPSDAAYINNNKSSIISSSSSYMNAFDVRGSKDYKISHLATTSNLR